MIDGFERTRRGMHDGWLGSVDALVTDDIADASRLSDLVGGGGDDLDVADLLRASRLPRLRPVLVVLAARASGGGSVDPELQYAAELLHVALTLHDLAIGPEKNRRHRVARRMLRSVGWLGGNRVMLRAMELARHAPVPGVLDDLLETLGAFAGGQEVAAQLLAEGVPTDALWKAHADGHTGALFSFCCRAGGRVSKARDGEIAAFGRYGRHIGRMWHLAEDVVLLQGEDAAEQLVGRALVGRPMLPVAVAAERDPEVAVGWRRLVEHTDPADAVALMERLHAVRAVIGTRERMAQEHWAARQALSRFPETPYRRALERLASGLSRAPYEDVGPRHGS